MNFEEFCERLKKDGAYQGEDGHIYRKDGRLLSRRCTNGYYMVRKMYETKTYNFMEHRVVWYFANGKFDESLTINHKDFNRDNNHIENLELMTQKENFKYTVDAGRWSAATAEKSGKVKFTNKEVQLMRYLKDNGWNTDQIYSMFGRDVHINAMRRIIYGHRYGIVPKAEDVTAIYPTIVDLTCRKDISEEEQIKECLMGLSGEVGELVDLYKKAFYHGHDIDINHAILEMGDILYYLTWLCNLLGIDIAEVMYQNMVKLDARYHDGFSVEKSLHRAKGDI